MNRTYLSAIAFAVASFTAGQVLASDAPKTRLQVKAELAEAIRTGDISANDRTGRKLNELFPQSYPRQEAVQGFTRAQVRADLAQAIRTGDIIATDESGRKLNEVYPHRYGQTAMEQGKTRAEVKAERTEAVRTDQTTVWFGA